MRPSTGITHLLRPDFTSRVAHISFVVLKGISTSTRYRSALDTSPPLPKLESPDTADLSQHISVVHANFLNRARGKAAPKWTPDECSKLKDAVAKGMSAKAIKTLFPSRSIGSIQTQCNTLLHNADQYGKTLSRGCRWWSSDETNLLRKLHADGVQPFKLRAYFPSRSIGSIRKAIIVHESPLEACRKKGTPWSHEDGRRLTELAQSMHKKAIAEALGRTIASVEHRAKSLGVKISTLRKEYTVEEVAVILQMRRDKVPYKQIAEKLGRSAHSIGNAYYRHRPLQDNDADVKKVLPPGLSFEELQSVSSLREQDVSWADIGRRYPMHSLELIREDHRRFVGYKLLPNEVREIKRLRNAGKEWRDIIELDLFYQKREDSLKRAYYQALKRQESQQ
ncbi:hypothetical protein Q7P35_011729 [Cladosporium inversicolor]